MREPLTLKERSYDRYINNHHRLRSVPARAAGWLTCRWARKGIMMQYKVLTFKNNRRGAKGMQKELNNLAVEGWRLATSVPARNFKLTVTLVKED